MLKLHYLQHVPFENLGNIRSWANKRKAIITGSCLYKNEDLPSVENFDWLIIMGGPMGVYDDRKYKWLTQEKKFIEEALNSNKVVLGICLGAQLIADVLGSRIYKNRYKEIGWFPVKLRDYALEYQHTNSIKNEFMAFHWHGDTFDIPKGAIHLAESNGCGNQAFAYGKRIIGLQFHLESSEDSIKNLFDNCSDDIEEGKYIQQAEYIYARVDYFKEIFKTMNIFLDNIVTIVG